MQIGRAAAAVLAGKTQHRPRFIIGKDTRISGDMLESALAAGLCSVGADVELLGVIPTPAVAHLVRKYGADAGVVISASHNPVEFNGIKLFGGEGYKLPDEVEEEIEHHVFNNGAELTLCTRYSHRDRPARGHGFVGLCRLSGKGDRRRPDGAEYRHRLCQRSGQ